MGKANHVSAKDPGPQKRGPGSSIFHRNLAGRAAQAKAER
jgi:hypothetical protein